uniref:Odv-e25 n=1 Tax=Chrysodeixis includens nucleopolyhedrovirus TaxID=1207438 RepID=A0A1C8ZZ15_9ABAC|nr:odv-e25 [Chrysodeixis includens nucleopolyhedrovirus]AOL57228.1 odv-e25 [Chrysodeixis includens nucleopolyhedrovirus]QGW49216.1 ODV-E25 [Chrysodeixis includens nucleopolyhedrovirus]QGW49356.1 ODV-E25 [Chrysodeixis includens nucleopolyhedrovirus]QGW49496.1 ODV-E25 [Chrysodeixis includens nucleopolyhedrovirus]
MIGTLVLIIIVLAVLYFLFVNNKLNMNSINESSPSLADSSNSLQADPQTGQLSVKFNSPKIKSLRVLHGENKISKIYVSERPLTYNEIIDEGNRSVGTNCVFVGTLLDTPSSATSAAAPTRTTTNFDVKQFKNVFIVFKNLESSKIKESTNMTRYEAEGMVYCLIDSTTTTVPDLRDVSYPIVVYTTNANVQLKLKEWDYTQLNDAGTLFLKNEKSFRLQ